MANEEHLAILKLGYKVWNEWRDENPEEPIVLTEADLRGAYLNRANLSGADLSKADLSGATLHMTNLNGADLSKADLSGATLHMTKLNGAGLSGAHLLRANLTYTNLNEADLSNTIFGHTTIANVDLSVVKGLESAEHFEPSTIGIDTIYRSGGKIPEVFLRGAGVPDSFITFMQSLTAEAIKFYSCFISHSSKDQEFVERLYADLQNKGVRCWYAPEDLKIGEPFLLGIEQGIRHHDKLLLILSESSVNSGWVQQEVLSAIAKEQGKAPWVLFPIRLDNAVMDTNVPWANMIRQSRHIGDFTHWKDHDSYRKAFDRLLRDLKEGE